MESQAEPPAIDSPCECEHNNPDSLDARTFFTVVLAVAPAVTMNEASSLSPAESPVELLVVVVVKAPLEPFPNPPESQAEPLAESLLELLVVVVVKALLEPFSEPQPPAEQSIEPPTKTHFE